MPDTGRETGPVPGLGKFIDPFVTAKGEVRATVTLRRLETLWFNTGSLCNIECNGCYIESSPLNDRLAYLGADEVARFVDEAEKDGMGLEEVGFTGGEPFLNRELPSMLAYVLARGYRVLVLTNAMKPMQRRRPELLALRARHGAALTLRVSIDHYRPELHETIRGPRSWAPMLDGLRWLCREGFRVDIAGRMLWGEQEAAVRAGFAALFASEGLGIDADDPAALVLFPEMNAVVDVPEITTRCWGIVGRSPEEMMCASSRMVLKRKGTAAPVVVPCTLLPYEPRFELGESLATARGAVSLNHPFCAQFCVLGGASCSAR